MPASHHSHEHIRHRTHNAAILARHSHDTRSVLTLCLLLAELGQLHGGADVTGRDGGARMLQLTRRPRQLRPQLVLGLHGNQCSRVMHPHIKIEENSISGAARKQESTGKEGAIGR